MAVVDDFNEALEMAMTVICVR